MSQLNRSLDVQSMPDLQDAIGMSAALKAAAEESPKAIVMAAVRAIEHVNVRLLGYEERLAWRQYRRRVQHKQIGDGLGQSLRRGPTWLATSAKPVTETFDVVSGNRPTPTTYASLWRRCTTTT